MIKLFKDDRQVSAVSALSAVRSLFIFMEKMRQAALEKKYGWSEYVTLQQYAQVCFWAIRKLEYGFIAKEFEALEKSVNRPLRVLDVGCGVVPLNNWMASRGHEVTAFDPLHDDIKFLVQNNLNYFYNTNVQYLTARGEYFPFPTSLFDVVTFVSVLEHTIPGNDQLILNEIARVLTPSGHLLMTLDVVPVRPPQEGENEQYQNLRRYNYPFSPKAVHQLIEKLALVFNVKSSEIPQALYDLTWDDVYAFWSVTQQHDGRTEKRREYLALGVAFQRNKSPYINSTDELINAYLKSQDALHEQLNFYRYHAEKRFVVIQDLQNQMTGQEKKLTSLRNELVANQNELVANQNELIAKEAVIQSFQRSFLYWLVHARYGRLIPYRKQFIRLASPTRFRHKLGVFNQYPPRPPRIPDRYYQQRTLADDKLPVISVVTPSYNQAVFLERTIQSVVSQQYSKLEYVIQDGNSTDSSTEVIEKYRSHFVYAESVRDNGQAHAVNLGFGHTSGEIMAYLNSDDMLLPGTLHFVASYFAKHPHIDVVYGHRMIVDENNNEVGIWVLPPHDRKMLEWGDYVPQETLFWRRGIWDKCGGKMDEAFKFALDWDMLIRFQEAGAKMVRLPRFLAMFRVHGAQKSTALINDIGTQEMNLLRQRIHGREVRLDEIITNLRPYLRWSIVYHHLYRMGVLRY